MRRGTRYVPPVIPLVRRRIALVAAAASFLVGVPCSAGAISGLVTLDGVAGVTPGMGSARVAELWGIARARADRPCSTVKFHVSDGNLNGYALFLHGRLGAVFFTSGASTATGLHIGTRKGRLRSLYGAQLRTVPGSSSYFLVRKKSPHWQIRFDVSKGAVSLIGFGDETVHFVGSCGAR